MFTSPGTKGSTNPNPANLPPTQEPPTKTANLIALNPATSILEIKAVKTGDEYLSTMLDVFDIDGDNLEEIFIAASKEASDDDITTGFVDIYDFTTGSSKIPPLSVNPAIGSAKVATYGNMTGNTVPDLVAITSFNQQNTDPAEDGHIYIYNILTGTTEWVSTGLAGGVDIEVADLDNDGINEIIAASNQRIIIYSSDPAQIPLTPLPHKAIVFPAIKDLVIADTDADTANELEIYVLVEENNTSVIYQLDIELEELASYTLTNKATSIHLEDIGTGRKNLVVNIPNAANSSGVSSSWLSVIDPGTGQEIISSPEIIGSVPINSLHYSNTDGNSSTYEMAFGTSDGMYLTR